jgi:hypothetical protein
LLDERGIDISHETVRFWWNRFGPTFAAELRKRRIAHMRGYPQWRWRLHEALVKLSGKPCYVRRAVDHEGQVFASKGKGCGVGAAQADHVEIRSAAERRHRRDSGLSGGDE